MSSSFPQVSLEAQEVLQRIAELGVNLTGHCEGSESLQHVTAFWSQHKELNERFRANSCNVAVLGLAKSGEPLPRCAPRTCMSLSHVLELILLAY